MRILQLNVNIVETPDPKPFLTTDTVMPK